MTATPVPLDEFPIHQAPVSMRYFGTTDRNVYDRCIMQCFEHSGETELITGLGVYPHLGVMDAYASLRRGSRQWSVRTSDALGTNRMEQCVGPIRFVRHGKTVIDNQHVQRAALTREGGQ